jgi:hypothetical protein
MEGTYGWRTPTHSGHVAGEPGIRQSESIIFICVCITVPNNGKRTIPLLFLKNALYAMFPSYELYLFFIRENKSLWCFTTGIDPLSMPPDSITSLTIH